MDDSETKRSKLESTLQITNNKNLQLEKELDSVLEEINPLKEKCENQESQIERLQKELEEAQHKRADVEVCLLWFQFFLGSDFF